MDRQKVCAWLPGRHIFDNVKKGKPNMNFPRFNDVHSQEYVHLAAQLGLEIHQHGHMMLSHG